MTQAPSASPSPNPAVEEARLSSPHAQQLLRHGGLDAAPARLAGELRSAGTEEGAELVIRRHARCLWRDAIRRLRAQDGDDRPLYWARLALAQAVRDSPLAAGSPEVAARLLTVLEHESRGICGNQLPAGPGRGRIVVTGFDPFQLDTDVRRSNPAGAAALALHGTTVHTAGGHTAHIAAVVLPVRWADFTHGIVEHALRPFLASGPRQADLLITLSQGRPGRFDLERFNGCWRGGGADNAQVRGSGPIPVGENAPQWTETTLPFERLTSEPTGPFPVRDHTGVRELPPGAGTEAVFRGDGPTTPDAAARAGGGGAYLSNEVAYRATLLRDRLGLRDQLPAGHLHTPTLEFSPENADPESLRFTDPRLITSRQDITAQIRALLTLAADQLPRDGGNPADGPGPTATATAGA